MILSTKGLSHNLYKHFLLGSRVTVSPYKNIGHPGLDLLSSSLEWDVLMIQWHLIICELSIIWGLVSVTRISSDETQSAPSQPTQEPQL